jgi:hypothetical protein
VRIGPDIPSASESVRQTFLGRHLRAEKPLVAQDRHVTRREPPTGDVLSFPPFSLYQLSVAAEEPFASLDGPVERAEKNCSPNPACSDAVGAAKVS